MALTTSTPSPSIGHIHLQDIQLTSPLGPDPWHRAQKPQPVNISVLISYRNAVTAAAATDDVSLTLDYGKLYKNIAKAVELVGLMSAERGDDEAGKAGRGVRELALAVTRASFKSLEGVSGPLAGREFGDPLSRVEVWIHFPTAVLLADQGLRYRSVTRWASLEDEEKEPQGLYLLGDGKSNLKVWEQEFRVEDIRCACVVGVNPHERVERQSVIVTLGFKGDGSSDWSWKVVTGYQEVTRAVVEVSGFYFPSLALISRFHPSVLIGVFYILLLHIACCAYGLLRCGS